MAFFGRKTELKKLESLLKKRFASLVVIKGRRRIGKSRLIAEFGKRFTHFYSFSGLPPTEKMTRDDQLREFGWQLGKALEQPPFKDEDWNDLFLRLASHTRRGKVLILFDEISWMGSKDPNFLGKLKNAWDLEFKKNPQLIVVLCGSVSAWIDRNILSSTGFLGRVSLNLTLEELPLSDCNQFWLTQMPHLSAYEKFKVLAVTGGVPKYLEEIRPNESAEENIRQLCFDKSGLLFNEFNHIFSDIFYTRSQIYKDIVTAILDGNYEYKDIYKKLGKEKSGVVSEYLEDLVKSGFVQRDYTWRLATANRSKLSRFRVSDNYIRFYLKYVFPNLEKIRKGGFEKASLALLQNWTTVMGLQFENLALNNRHKIQEILNIKPEEIVYDNPFFQKKTHRMEGCQIDYLIQTRFNTLYVCEIKFSTSEIKTPILSEIKQKIACLKIPRHMSYRAVLIHVNGVSEEVLECQYFSHCIDFSEILKNDN